MVVKPYPLCERYLVSESGSVFAFRGKKLAPKKTYMHPKGYHKVKLYYDGCVHVTNLHRMVLIAFSGENPSHLNAAHLDGNKDNNHISNLIWCTAKENAQHKILHGTMFGKCKSRTGKSHWKTILTEEQVLAIRSAYQPKVVTHAILAARY